MSYHRYSIRTPAPRRNFFSFGGVVKLLLLVAAVCAAGWLIFQQTVRNQLGEAVQAKIQEQLSPLGMNVLIGDARFAEGKGLTLDDVDLFLPPPASSTSVSGSNLPVSTNLPVSSNLQIEQLHVHSHSTLTDLATGAFKPDSIEIRRAKLQVVRGHNGQFDLAPIVAQLSQLSPAGQTNIAPVTLRDSVIEIVTLDQSVPTITLSKMNFAVSQVEFQRQPLIHIQGEFNTKAISQIGISLFVNQQSKTWNAQLSCDGATISRDVLKSLPPSVASQFAQTQSINGQLSFNATASGNERLDQLPAFEVNGRVDNFSINDPRLPVEIAGISTEFLVNNNGVVVQNVRGLMDQTSEVNLSYTQVGLFPRQAWRCAGKVNNFVLNNRARLAAWLPATGHKFMEDFSPNGTSNLAFDFSHDGSSLSKKITGDITNMSFAFIRMPYRVDGCTGRVELKDSHCDFSVQSTIHSQPASLSGYADNIGTGPPTYRVNLDVQGDIPIDEKLLNSTTAQPALSKVIHAFSPSGFVSGRGVVERATPGGPVNKWFDIRLKECNVQHDSFAYPIHHVSGQVLVNNSNFEFKNLKGKNNNGLVYCNGFWGEASGLDLAFQCRNVPLDEQLRQALQPEIQEIWDGFRPRGAVEQMDVFLRLPLGAKQVDLQLEATFPESDAAASSYVSIFPIWFPYQINHLTGKLTVGRGRINLTDASGRHHKTRFACEGQGRYTDTDWSLRLKNLLVTALPVDADLLAAVPKSLASPLAQLRFNGLANVNGEVTLAGAKIHNDFTPTPNLQPGQVNQAQFANQLASGGRVQQASHATLAAYNPPESSMAWDVRINTNQADMLIGLPLKNVFGGVRLTGIYDGQNIDCDGQLDLDSMTVYDNQVTKITGPFKIDNKRVTAGKFVQKFSQDQGVIDSLQTIVPTTAESISGILHKGVVRLDAYMNTSGKNDFFVRSTLADGCIATACQEIAPELENVTGHSFAEFEMTGDYTGTHSHRGAGRVELRDAKIYELPVFISLLKILNVRQLTRTAFDSGNIDFKLLGERIVFERMEFIGDAISLLGEGEMNLDWDIDLNFYTVIGRNRLNIPLLSKLYRASSQRTLAIRVDGKLDNPRTHSEVLPEFNENMKRLFNAESAIANRFSTPVDQSSRQSRPTKVGQNFFQQAQQLPIRIDTPLQR